MHCNMNCKYEFVKRKTNITFQKRFKVLVNQITTETNKSSNEIRQNNVIPYCIDLYNTL